MNAMLNLFDAPIVACLPMDGDVVSTEEEATLIAHIDNTGLNQFRFQQWTGKRLNRSYGWSHDFSTGVLAPAEPMPDWLDNVRRRAARLADLDAVELVQALPIRYDPGAGISWHKDRQVFEHVVGISLGHAATLRLRRRSDRGWSRPGPISRRARSTICPAR